MDRTTLSLRPPDGEWSTCNHVTKYESGERRLDVVEFVEVAEAIGFDASEVIRELAKKGHGR